ncbi:hypothetical protein BLNAU_5400 [Blattamonas nauphoetae]|uniref:Trichohyalin n=1 Tax=Blattamonas nauphoetae TaxID=2049346 RepID=A0ABQ9Y781_9EUKA|nr:hypothetical protein BLNAU_5400 [Blattamonas nauphoetae]
MNTGSTQRGSVRVKNPQPWTSFPNAEEQQEIQDLKNMMDFLLHQTQTIANIDLPTKATHIQPESTSHRDPSINYVSYKRQNSSDQTPSRNVGSTSSNNRNDVSVHASQHDQVNIQDSSSIDQFVGQNPSTVLNYDEVRYSAEELSENDYEEYPNIDEEDGWPRRKQRVDYTPPKYLKSREQLEEEARAREMEECSFRPVTHEFRSVPNQKTENEIRQWVTQRNQQISKVEEAQKQSKYVPPNEGPTSRITHDRLSFCKEKDDSYYVVFGKTIKKDSVEKYEQERTKTWDPNKIAKEANRRRPGSTDRQFRAREIPSSTLERRFDQIREREAERRSKSKDSWRTKLNEVMDPFSFEERDKKLTVTKNLDRERALREKEKREMEIGDKPPPPPLCQEVFSSERPDKYRIVFGQTVFLKDEDEMKQQASEQNERLALNRKEREERMQRLKEERELRGETDEQEERKGVEYTDGYALTREHTFQPVVHHTIPDYEKLQEQFQRELEKRKKAKKVTKEKPFDFESKRLMERREEERREEERKRKEEEKERKEEELKRKRERIERGELDEDEAKDERVWVPPKWLGEDGKPTEPEVLTEKQEQMREVVRERQRRREMAENREAKEQKERQERIRKMSRKIQPLVSLKQRNADRKDRDAEIKKEKEEMNATARRKDEESRRAREEKVRQRPFLFQQVTIENERLRKEREMQREREREEEERERRRQKKKMEKWMEEKLNRQKKKDQDWEVGVDEYDSDEEDQPQDPIGVHPREPKSLTIEDAMWEKAGEEEEERSDEEKDNVLNRGPLRSSDPKGRRMGSGERRRWENQDDSVDESTISEGDSESSSCSCSCSCHDHSSDEYSQYE